MKNNILKIIKTVLVLLFVLFLGYIGGIYSTYEEEYLSGYDDGVKDGSEAVLDTMIKMLNYHHYNKNKVSDLKIETPNDTIKVYLSSKVFLNEKK